MIQWMILLWTHLFGIIRLSQIWGLVSLLKIRMSSTLLNSYMIALTKVKSIRILYKRIWLISFGSSITDVCEYKYNEPMRKRNIIEFCAIKWRIPRSLFLVFSLNKFLEPFAIYTYVQLWYITQVNFSTCTEILYKKQTCFVKLL